MASNALIQFLTMNLILLYRYLCITNLVHIKIINIESIYMQNSRKAKRNEVSLSQDRVAVCVKNLSGRRSEKYASNNKLCSIFKLIRN